MNKISGKHKNKYTPEHYLENIILKLDRIEAELITVKLASVENTRETRLLGEKVEGKEK